MSAKEDRFHRSEWFLDTVIAATDRIGVHYPTVHRRLPPYSWRGQFDARTGDASSHSDSVESLLFGLLVCVLRILLPTETSRFL